MALHLHCMQQTRCSIPGPAASSSCRPARPRIDDLPLFANLSPPPMPEPVAEAPDDGLRRALDAIDPDALTPREALEALYRLKAASAGDAP